MRDPVAAGHGETRGGSLHDHLRPLLAARGTTLDPAQQRALERLQRLADELATFRAARQSKLMRLFARPDVPRGLYLWGGVGRGKSLLMDSFYAKAAIRRRIPSCAPGAAAMS